MKFLWDYLYFRTVMVIFSLPLQLYFHSFKMLPVAQKADIQGLVQGTSLPSDFWMEQSNRKLLQQGRRQKGNNIGYSFPMLASLQRYPPPIPPFLVNTCHTSHQGVELTSASLDCGMAFDQLQQIEYSGRPFWDF